MGGLLRSLETRSIWARGSHLHCSRHPYRLLSPAALQRSRHLGQGGAEIAAGDLLQLRGRAAIAVRCCCDAAAAGIHRCLTCCATRPPPAVALYSGCLMRHCPDDAAGRGWRGAARQGLSPTAFSHPPPHGNGPAVGKKQHGPASKKAMVGTDQRVALNCALASMKPSHRSGSLGRLRGCRIVRGGSRSGPKPRPEKVEISNQHLPETP